MFEWVANSQTWDFIVSLFLAMVSGLVIGAEREIRGKDAGMRTYTFVVVGATLFTFMSTLIFTEDKTKLAAPIITGIGFLGAGLIMKGNRGHVQNLTTAASVWYSAAIGMLFGFGYYLYGIIATIFALYISWMPHVKKAFSRGAYPRRSVY
jgi:putative Mg2+ transporter-C (MgtC) family protein